MAENPLNINEDPDAQPLFQERFFQTLRHARDPSHRGGLVEEDSFSSSSSDSSEFKFLQHPNEERQRQKRAGHNHPINLGNASTAVNLLKANVSAGLLAMPKALANFGMVAGVLGILLIGIFVVLSIHLLLEVSRGIARRIKMEQDSKNMENHMRSLVQKYQQKERKDARQKARRIRKMKRTKGKRKYEVDFEKRHSSKQLDISLDENRKEWKQKYQKDFEEGHSSKQLDISSDENQKEWKQKYKEDFEEGHSSKQLDISSDEGNTETELENAQLEEAYGARVRSLTVSVPLKDLEDADNEFQQIQKFLTVNYEEDIDKLMRSLHYPKLIEWSFLLGRKYLMWATKMFKYYAKVMLIMTHIGCCCVCFLFTAESISEISMTSQYVTHAGSFIILAYALPFMVFISSISDKYRQNSTFMALFLQIIGVAIMFYFFLTGPHSKNYHPYVAPAGSWSLYCGIIFYAFEGTGLTLHLESHMENRTALRGTTGVFNKVMFFMVFLCSFLGLFGYWKYGNDVKTSVSFDLPEGPLGDIAQFITALGVLLTYPFHFSFVFTPFRRALIKDEHLHHPKMKLFIDLILRAVLVVFTYVIAAIIPYMELQISVLGATASCFFVLIVPSLMYLNTYGELPGVRYSWEKLIFFSVVLLTGISGTSMVIYMTIKNLPLYYPNGAIFG